MKRCRIKGTNQNKEVAMKDLKADKYIPYEVISRALIQFINEDWLILGDIHQVESDE